MIIFDWLSRLAIEQYIHILKKGIQYCELLHGTDQSLTHSHTLTSILVHSIVRLFLMPSLSLFSKIVGVWSRAVWIALTSLPSGVPWATEGPNDVGRRRGRTLYVLVTMPQARSAYHCSWLSVFPLWRGDRDKDDELALKSSGEEGRAINVLVTTKMMSWPSLWRGRTRNKRVSDHWRSPEMCT